MNDQYQNSYKQKATLLTHIAKVGTYITATKLELSIIAA